jgi:hypothetical protein
MADAPGREAITRLPGGKHYRMSLGTAVKHQIKGRQVRKEIAPELGIGAGFRLMEHQFDSALFE